MDHWRYSGGVACLWSTAACISALIIASFHSLPVLLSLCASVRKVHVTPAAAQPSRAPGRCRCTGSQSAQLLPSEGSCPHSKPAHPFWISRTQPFSRRPAWLCQGQCRGGGGRT